MAAQGENIDHSDQDQIENIDHTIKFKRRTKTNSLDPKDYVLFWGVKNEAGEFSQWYQSDFLVKRDDGTEMTFSSCEQWMMYNKALLFLHKDPIHNQKVIGQIMKTNSQRKIKQLGRQVRGFDDKVWKQHRFNIVYQGNLMKFSQNPVLQKMLLDTKDQIIVEASPYDRIWGVGFTPEYALRGDNTKKWGLNLLGEAIMEVRETLKKS